MIRAKIESIDADRIFPSNTGIQGERLVQVSVGLGWRPWFGSPFFVRLARFRSWNRKHASMIQAMVFAMIVATLINGAEYLANVLPVWLSAAVETIFVRNNLAHFLAIVLAGIVLTQLYRRRLDPILVYILKPDEPFPIPLVPYSERERHIFVIRVLGPNLDKQLHGYLELNEPIHIDRTHPPNMPDGHEPEVILDVLKRTNKVEREAAENFWPLVRVALDRTLYRSRHEESPATMERIAKHPWFFMYLVHVPQIAGFVFLTALMLTLFVVFGAEEMKDEKELTAVCLGGAATIWGLLSIYLHRKQSGALTEWAQKWADNPFANNPVFYYQRDGVETQRWEELMSVDFSARIQEFGLDNNKLLDGLIAFLILGFFSLMDAIK